MILGYARVSTRDQNLDGQRDALTVIGAERIFADTITGTTRSRPELDRLLRELRDGDVVIVTKYDRLARSLKDLLEIVDHILLVPLGASFLEFDSTGRFFDMLHATFASIEDGENSQRRALGLSEIKFEWDVVRAIITRFDAGQQTDLANVIQAYFGDFMNTYRQ